MPWLLGFAVVAVVLLAAKSIAQERPPVFDASNPPPPAVPGPPPKRTGKLNDDLLAAAVALIPPGVVLRASDAAIDPVYGGRKADLNGAPVWAYYQTILGTNPDGSFRKGGTTCGIVLGYLMSLAGWPKDMVNRSPTDAWAPGGGFTPGEPIAKEIGGAKKHGYYKDAAAVG